MGGLELRVFELSGTPCESLDDRLAELPESDVSLRARFIGLFGEVRLKLDRGEVIFGLVAERNESLTLGGKGLARGEGVWFGVLDGALLSSDDLPEDFGEGEWTETGEELADLDVTKRNLDGERDSERRKDLTADVTST